MKKRHKLVVLIIVLLICFSFSTGVLAYPISDGIVLSYQTQAKSLWCWADCGSVTLHYFGIYDDQYDFCYHTFLNYNNQGADISQVQTGFGYYSISSTAYNSYLSFGSIQSQIYYYNRPIFANTYIYYHMPHAVLIDGYDTEFGNYITYMNPRWEPNSTISVYMSYNDFLDNEEFFWWKTLYNIHD